VAALLGAAVGDVPQREGDPQPESEVLRVAEPRHDLLVACDGLVDATETRERDPLGDEGTRDVDLPLAVTGVPAGRKDRVAVRDLPLELLGRLHPATAGYADAGQPADPAGRRPRRRPRAAPSAPGPGRKLPPP